MPRAATSVATRASTCPRTNESSARSRCFWLRSPWMAAARMPRCSSWRAIRSAPCLVRQNTMVGPAAATTEAVISTRSPGATFQKRWTASLASSSASSSCRTGFFW